MIENRYLDALFKLILLSAIAHLIVLAVQSLRAGDISILNYFNILDVDLFLPSIAQGLRSQIASVLVMAGLYLGIYYFFTKQKN